MVRPFQVLLTAGALLLGSIPATGPVAMNRPGNRELADTLTVSSRVQCGRCRVTLARVADLARGEGYDVDVPSFSVVRTDNGRFFATGYGEPRTITAFGADGRVIGTVGRRGEGPGEFTSPKAVGLVGDSVVVLDRTSRRLSIFAPGGRYLRSVGIATISALGFSVLGDNRIIVAGLSSTPQAVGYGWHLVAPGDLPPQPFGTRESVVTPERQAWLRRVTTPANARGAVWASRVNQYELTLFGPSGDPLRTIRRRPQISRNNQR